MKGKKEMKNGLERQAKVILLHLISAANKMSAEEFLQEVHYCCERFARDYTCYSHERCFKHACEEYLSK